ncbi:MAG: hypothetical protein HYS53_03335 [Candidatus Aenigmarchaeota archaeon]|nr:hypothetical protein [Candidatus Aenigmarchaeota archaeon]
MAAPFKAYWTQVHPIFMIAALQAGLVGSLFYSPFDLYRFAVVAIGIFSALYYAHVKDSYVDYYVRHEDPAAQLTRKQSKLALAGSVLVFFACMAYLYTVSGWLIIPLMIGGLALAYAHAPYLDMNPLGATAGYPTGLFLATLAGFYSQAGFIGFSVLAFSFVVWIILNGVKIVDDIKDYGWDKPFGKRSAVVALGKRNAKLAGCALVAAGAVLGILLSLYGIFSTTTSAAFASLLPFAFVSMGKDSRKGLYGLYVLLAGVYVFTISEIIILFFGL